MVTFFVGDIVRCEQSRSLAGSYHVKGLMINQRFEVSRVMNWPDGSQSLFVVARPKSQKTNREPPDPGERGPYCSRRFILDPESVPTRMYQYDPSQLGDLDDGI
jgi:hypothetical protein